MKLNYTCAITGALVALVFTASSHAQGAARNPAHAAPQGYQGLPATDCNGCPPSPNNGKPLSAAYAPAPAAANPAQQNTLPYDLLLQHGHVIDPKNNIDKVADVGIKDGRIAAVGDLKASDALKAVDVTNMIVSPGLIDIHIHVYPSTSEWLARSNDTPAHPGESPITPRMSWHTLWPDGFTFRTGVTTVVDAGTAGWRDFEDFKEHVIDRSQTRILVMLNIVGAGMRGSSYENNLEDMDGTLTGNMAKRYPGIIVGVKSAHFTGPEWHPYIEAVKAGNIAGIPVMVDYGSNRIERPMAELVSKYLRPGDIYTHTFSGLRSEQDTVTLKPSAGLLGGRAHGVYFDAGTGGGSFRFRVAVPLLRAGFKPDSLSTDLHIDSMNFTTIDMLNVMSKFMTMGESLHEVIEQSTSHPAHEVHRDDLGNLSVGSVADVAVLSEKKGRFGFVDMDAMKMTGDTKLVCQLTVHNGRVVYDLNGITMDPWNQLAPSTNQRLAAHWTSFRPTAPLPNQLAAGQK